MQAAGDMVQIEIPILWDSYSSPETFRNCHEEPIVSFLVKLIWTFPLIFVQLTCKDGYLFIEKNQLEKLRLYFKMFRVSDITPTETNSGEMYNWRIKCAICMQAAGDMVSNGNSHSLRTNESNP